MIRCAKKGCDVVREEECDFHHVIPRFMGGTDLDGRKYLCKKHHSILHNIVPSIIWKEVSEDRKVIVKQKVKEFTNYWLTK